MSICPSCQTINPDNYQFCQACGTKIAVSVAMDVVTKKEEQVSQLDQASQTGQTDQTEQANQIAPTNDQNSSIARGENIKKQQQEELFNQPLSETDWEVFANREIAPVTDTEAPVNSEMNDNSLQGLDRQTNDLQNPVNGSSNSGNALDPYGDTVPDNLPNDLLMDFPKYLQGFSYLGATDLGKQRDRNEDDFVTIGQSYRAKGKSLITKDHSDRGLFVVCDGMGGHEGGEEASAIAINSLVQQFQLFWTNGLPGERKLREIITNINQEIYAKNDNEQRQSLGRMGTTLAMLALHNLDVAIAHVGDSRIYRITRGSDQRSPQLEQITRDHEVWNQLVDRGLDLQTAQARPDAYQLTQALGPNPNDGIEPAVQFFSITESTLFLLCSDGLSDNEVIEENWQEYLLPILTESRDLEIALKDLINLGNRLNGHDNLSAILVLCELSDK